MDARTKNGKLRVTSFVEDDIADLIDDFNEWVQDNNVKKEDLWFCRIFDVKGPRHVGNLGLDESGRITRELAPPDSTLTLKDSKYTLGVRLRYLFNRL